MAASLRSFIITKLFSFLILCSPGEYFSIHDVEFDTLFKEFTTHYNRSYIGNNSEYVARLETFKINVERANLLNQKYHYNGKPAVHGINKFSDMTPEQFTEQYLSDYKPQPLKFQTSSFRLKPLNLTGLPRKVDWRAKGLVTGIKNQGVCGACWAFSVVEVMESMVAIQYGLDLKSLSVQELIDCDFLDQGCKGGDICSSARWSSKYGVVKESEYPLTDTTESCKAISPSLMKVEVRQYMCNRYIGREQDILPLLAAGPVAVAVDANTWHSYVGGIIQYHCSGQVNHAVVIVGYDLTGDVPHYIVRNSWGTDFGDEGYLYVKFGGNICEIATEVVTLTVTKPS